MTDRILALERLAKLKTEGAISPEEYEVQKAKLMVFQSSPPWYRRLWVVVVMTVGLITMPLALLILATGAVYKRSEGGLQPISSGARALYAGGLVVWLAGAFVNAVLFPNTGFMGALDGSGKPVRAETALGAGNQAPAAQAGAQAGSNGGQIVAGAVGPAQAQGPVQTAEAAPTVQNSDGPPACTDPEIRQMATEGMQAGFDKMGMGFEPTMKEALGNLHEGDSEEAARYKRILTTPPDGDLRTDEVRICEGAGKELDYLGMTAVFQHNGKIGGYVLISGLRTPVPFGDLDK